MRRLHLLVVAVLAVGMVVPASAFGGFASPTADRSVTGAAVASTPSTAVDTAATPGNNSSVDVTVGQQLSTVIQASSSNVSASVDEIGFEAAYEEAGDEERAELLAERAAELRERAREIRAEYREATREYEDGDVSKSEYARRLAVLNTEATDLLDSVEAIQRRAENVSGFRLATAGFNRTALEDALADVENLTGTGASELLRQFTGQSTGSIEIETTNGLSIEVESGDGERSREVRRPRDDDDSITVDQTAALETARAALSIQTGDWTLSTASVHPESGYYRFEFGLRTNGSVGEAEVRVDGSTGEVFRVEEEIERRDDAEDDDADDEESDDAEDGEPDEVDELAMLLASGTPGPNATIEVQVLADGTPAANVTIALNGDPVATTGADGTATVTLPASGEAKLTASSGDEDAELEFEFEREDDRDRTFAGVATSVSYDGGRVTFTLSHEGSGVGNVTVSADGDVVGTTDASGTVTFAHDVGEEVAIGAEKGEFELEETYVLRDGSLVLAEGEREDETENESDSGEDDGDDTEVETLDLTVVEGDPARDATVTVQVTADGAAVEGATVEVNGQVVGETAPDGTLQVTLPDTEDVRVEAEYGGESARLEWEFEEDG